MAKKKVVKATAKDKEIKAKPTGYRFKTKDVPALNKADGTLNKKGKKLQFKRPLKSEIEEFKKDADGNYPDDVKQIYHEKRDDKTHSDDNLKKKYEDGGTAIVEMSIDDMKVALGREPKYPYDFINGKKYVKCFLRPYYKLKENE
jgi:hypothetical protein